MAAAATTSSTTLSALFDKVASLAGPIVAGGAANAQLRAQRIRQASLAVAVAGGALYYVRRQRQAANLRATVRKNGSTDVTTDAPIKLDRNSVKVAVDKRFMRQLKYILKICVPTLQSKTVLILILHTSFLVLRTYLSVVGARLDGRLVRDLVNADPRSFGRGLIWWFIVAIPSTYTNSMIRYLQSKLAIVLRTSLTRHVHDLYMENNTYYKAINLDNRIDNADQLITTDISRFCTALASLYSNLGKPVLDMIIFNYQLARSIGHSGMWGLGVNYLITATILRAATPAFGKMAAVEAKLEGDFRSAHSRLITNAEEIAFYHGAHLEKSILRRTYYKLIKHINQIYRIRIAYNMFEDFIIKYTWSAAGLMIASIPVFYPEWAGARSKREELRLAELQAGDTATLVDGVNAISQADRRTGSRTQGFITNKRLMVSLADAGGRIMYSYKELSELAGYTYRVYNMLRVLQDLHDDKYVNTGNENAEFSLERIEGKLDYDYNGIKFDHSPIVTPNGDTVLINDLSFQIGPGEHLMITGPNGAGKTSILRTLAGLWPIFRGEISRPSDSLSSVLYIPQRPYLAIGSLREQVIYPHTVDQMRKAGKTDDDLAVILKKVYLEYIPAREGGWDAVKEWKDVFSGGEKQRMQIARLFYHQPRFAVLDEATSAVSNDVEALMYSTAKDEGITLITISHRPSLFKYHHHLLRVGEGPTGKGWSLEQIGQGHHPASKFLESVESEIKALEARVDEVEGLKSRLEKINRELSLDTSSGSGSSSSGAVKGKEGELKHAKRTLI
ncbi:ABC transporter transmembrane region 2-domain-containing protein [Phlyctochytrium arcticum]|nr:ABC transporter transmembrane region 2-domain-containing protein [Phlyctochytrium arcticum]